MNSLDDPALLSLDASGMFGHIADVGPQLVRAWQAAESFALPPGARAVSAVVVAGVGGSATAGDYFAALCAPTAEIPVQVVRGYALPNFVSEATLVIVCSYSGNTKEALACYDDAWRRGAQLAVITGGGALARRAAEDGTSAHLIAYRASPRATTVHSLAPLIRVGVALGLCHVGHGEVREAARLHSAAVESELAPAVPCGRNRAKQVAVSLAGCAPIVAGGEHLAAAAVRFKNQLAENGKTLATAESLPEAAHNLVVGLEGARDRALALVALESRALFDPRVQVTFDAAAALFAEAGAAVHRFDVAGATPLEQLLVATALGDYVSCYLALAQGFDPTPIPQIQRLRTA